MFFFIQQAKYLKTMGVAVEQEEASSLKRSLSNEAASELGDLDRILDFVLCCLAHNLTNTSSSQRVPDLNMSFPLKYGYIEVQCHLSAQEGAVDGFETLHRDGRATTFRGEDGKLVLDATAGLHFMRLRYAQYTLRVGLVTLQGTLENHMARQLPGINVAQSRECLQEKQDEQSNREKKLNLNKDNSLSRFMISPYFGKPLEHKSTVPFRCHC
ncbi:Protein of unknown function [Gryllus bimaculatus]|nr:Protein of unknown function [Gryllus bimaculatus]